MRTYEGFPDGVSNDFCAHAAVAKSQYGSTAAALAAEVLALRRELVEVANALLAYGCHDGDKSCGVIQHKDRAWEIVDRCTCGWDDVEAKAEAIISEFRS